MLIWCLFTLESYYVYPKYLFTLFKLARIKYFYLHHEKKILKTHCIKMILTSAIIKDHTALLGFCYLWKIRHDFD